MSKLKQMLHRYYINYEHWKNTQWDVFITKDLKPFLATNNGKHWLHNEEWILAIAFILMIVMGIIHCSGFSIVIAIVALAITWLNTFKAIKLNNKN